MIDNIDPLVEDLQSADGPYLSDLQNEIGTGAVTKLVADLFNRQSDLKLPVPGFNRQPALTLPAPGFGRQPALNLPAPGFGRQPDFGDLPANPFGSPTVPTINGRLLDASEGNLLNASGGLLLNASG